MNGFKSIQQAFLTVLLMAFGSSIGHAAASTACPEFTQPKNWRLPLIIIDHAATNGPPEIARAAAALRAGRRVDAVALLAIAGNTPIKDAVQHGRAYSQAVLDAQENAWLLDGCP